MTRLLAILGALSAITLALPAAAQDVKPIEIEAAPAPIVKLLHDYSRAWKTKDSALLASTLAGSLRTREVRALANASKVPFTAFVVRPTTQYSGNLASRRVRALHPKASDVATYHVIESSQIGSESQTFLEEGAFTFAKVAGAKVAGAKVGTGGAYEGWRLVSKSDLDVLGFFSPFHLWDEKPVSVIESERFTLLTHRDVAQRLRPVLEVAEEGYDIASKFWSDDSRDHLVMIVPSTTAELGRVLHETIDLDKFVAFVGASASRERGWNPAGPRVFVHLSHLDNYGRSGRLEIFAHELIHALTRDESGPEVPVWIEEGLANLGGGNGGRPRVVLSGPPPAGFPTDDRFVSGPVGEIQGVYDQAQVAIQVLDERFGRAGLMRFYKELGSRRVAAGTEEFHVRDSVERSVGWKYAEWLDAFRAALRSG